MRQYQAINKLLSKEFTDRQASVELIAEINKKTESISPTQPFGYILNFEEAVNALRQTPYWLSQGGSRTGSTYITLLLEALMSSLSQSYLKGWEGDFKKTSNFFDIVRHSECIEAGILKIHRADECCKSFLSSGEAKAVVSTRDYPSIAKSWKRVFFTKGFKPSDREIINFVKEEIETEKRKREMPNTLFVKYKDIEQSKEDLISEISSFLGISLHQASIRHISAKLSKKSIAKLLTHLSINNSGHDSKTFLHINHISDITYEDAYTENIIRERFQNQLDKDGYLRED